VAEGRLARGGQWSPAREVTAGELALRALEQVGPRGQVLEVQPRGLRQTVHARVERIAVPARAQARRPAADVHGTVRDLAVEQVTLDAYAARRGHRSPIPGTRLR
jgi:hypothetical protein